MKNLNNKQTGVITVRVVLLSIFLTILLAASSTYLALKIGVLPSASIPAAILAMAILRFFKNTNIYETNLIQTAASAGEAVAGGIVFTIPALVIIHYWYHFPYLENVAIALSGGLLGILFSIPLRRILVKAEQLYFPEAKAVAGILQLAKKQLMHIRDMIFGACVGGVLELAQTGFKIIASAAEKWVTIGKSKVLFGFGIGFSPALIGVGYLIGFDLGLSLALGAWIAWGVCLPLFSAFTALTGPFCIETSLAYYRINNHYVGLGAMLVAGLWTLLNLLKPFYESLALAVTGLFKTHTQKLPLLASEQDIPGIYLFLGLIVLVIGMDVLFEYLFPLKTLGVGASHFFILVAVLYVFAMGFIFSSICGYFSGLVGVTASPGSAIITAGLLLIAVILRAFLIFQGQSLQSVQLPTVAAIALMIGAVVAGSAAVANDNIQDLKVGHLIGAKPWQQQLMLMLGVLVAALVIPYVMEILFNVYGLTTVLPHAGMDPTQSLPAPPAAMMAGLTQSVLNHNLPWNMLGIGGFIMMILIILSLLGLRKISLLGVGMGIYLPLSSSMSLFIGSLFAFFIQKIHAHCQGTRTQLQMNPRQPDASLLACGLVAGSSLMDVLIAIPVSVMKNSTLLAFAPSHWGGMATMLGFLSVLGIGFAFYRVSRANLIALE